MFRLPALLAFVLDTTWVLLAGVVVFVLVTGGGAYEWFGRRISIETVGNPLLGLQLIAVLRLFSLRHVPFLLTNRYPLEDAGSRCLAWCRRLGRALSEVSREDARKTILVVIVGITLVKLANAACYPGFFSGDDVEIHEMTFARLFGWKWKAWELRNAFYPMTFIYPVQALLVRAGLTDVAWLVFAGRAIVATLSSVAVWLTYRAGEVLDGPGVGLIASVVLAVHRLHVTFGGSELPRPVASVFLVGAFLCLCSANARITRLALAGCLLALGASLRFGELVFVVPAALMTALTNRPRDAAVVVVSFLLAAGLILGLSDAWYWGAPFYSLRKVVEYTLVDRLSSRGYEVPWYYLSALTSWTSVPVALLGFYAAYRRDWQPALWWLLPLLVLSLLPHKEPRYLIAILPFLCLNAAQGLRHLLRDLNGEFPWRLRIPSAAVARVALVLCAGGLLQEIGGWRFRKPSEPLEIARFISSEGCRGDVAIEQLWRAGGRLYLQSCANLIDLDPAVTKESSRLQPLLVAPSLEWVVLRKPLTDEQERLLDAAHFRVVTPRFERSYSVTRR